MVRPTTLVVLGVIMAGIGVLVGWYVFPNVFHSKIEEAKQLRKGTENRKTWTKFPISVDFKIYLFNITNPDEVQAGKKPKVQEIGPYFYQEWKAKTNLVDNPEDDTITYNMVNTFIFDEEKTIPLTGDEIVVLPNILILSFATIAMKTNPATLNMINKAIPHIFGDPKTIFYTISVKEFLFDGILLNCTKSKEFAVNAICDQLKSNPKGLEVLDSDYFKFSLFGMKNATPEEKTLTVKRGLQNIDEVGEVVAYNGKPEMDYWSGPYCNQIKGSDTTIFPPFMKKENTWNFGAEICRSLETKYVGKKDYKGIDGYHYTADLGDMSTDTNLKCFCPTNDTCMKKGAFDLTKCTGAPLILTLPHCYECHIDYLNSVIGLNPSKELHGIYSTFEPITGTPVEGRRRMQFNIFVQRNKKITIMKGLSEEPLLVPFMWIDEGLDLNDTMATKIKKMLYRPVKIVNVGRIVLVVFGIILIVIAIILFYLKQNIPDSSATEDNKTTITQVSPMY